jgi:hypothetical protein
MSTPIRSEPSVFLSHTYADKLFAARLANDLKAAGAFVWIDEAQIQIGDSLIEKIREGIDAMEYLAVVLSPDSVESEWVRRELDIAMNQEIEGKKVKVLPLLYKLCELPGFLKGKVYADFTDPNNYGSVLMRLLRQLRLPVASQTCEGMGPPGTRYSGPYPVDVVYLTWDLCSEAMDLLLKSADDRFHIIATFWLETESPPRLQGLETGGWRITSGSEYGMPTWETALKTLEERGLIRHAASRFGYRAYKLSREGWACADHLRHAHD